MSELKLRRTKSTPKPQMQSPIQGPGSGGVKGANRYLNMLRSRDMAPRAMLEGFLPGGIAAGLAMKMKGGRNPTSEQGLASLAFPSLLAFAQLGRTLRDPYKEDIQDYLDWSYGADDRYSPVYEKEGLLRKPAVKSLKPKNIPMEWEHETY